MTYHVWNSHNNMHSLASYVRKTYTAIKITYTRLIG